MRNIPRTIAIGLLAALLIGLIVACSSAGAGMGGAGLDERQAALQREIAAATATSAAAATATTMAGTSIAEATGISIQATDHVIRQTVEAGYTTATSVAQATTDNATAVFMQIQQTADAGFVQSTGTAEANKAAYERDVREKQAEVERLDIVWQQVKIGLAIAVVAIIAIPALYGSIAAIRYFTHTRREIRTVDGNTFAPAGLYETPRRQPAINGDYEVMPDPAGALPDLQGQQPAPNIIELPHQLRPGEIGLGVNADNVGQSLYLPVERMALLAVGLPEVGKSVLLRLVAYQMWKQRWKLFLVDPEHNALPPEVWGNVAATPAQYDEVLEMILAEADRRMALFGQARVHLQRHVSREEWFSVETLPSYNRAAEILGMPPLERMGLLVDEANTLIGRKPETDDKLFAVMRTRRKIGLAVITAMHNAHAATVPTAVTDLFPVRLAFFCRHRTSRVVIGRPDAATRLTINDKGKAFTWGLPFDMLQTYYIPPERIQREVKPTKLVMPPVTWDMRGSHLLTAGHEPDRALPAGDYRLMDGNGGSNGHTAGQGDDEEYRREVIALARQGMSLRNINMELHGSYGGDTFAVVRQICIDAGLYDPDTKQMRRWAEHD